LPMAPTEAVLKDGALTAAISRVRIIQSSPDFWKAVGQEVN
jgi:hypothetical protein